MERRTCYQIVLLIAFVILITSIPDLLASRDIDKEIKTKFGKLLTEEFGCVDCHTPKIVINNQVLIDENRMFSGHQQDNILPEFPPELVAPGKWKGLYTADMTAWGGPWGISYAANLTPDKKTGIGNLSEENFISILGLGIHSTLSRKIMPPMPWNEISRLNKQELGAIYLYLKTIKPIKNKVPEAVPLYNHEQPVNK